MRCENKNRKCVWSSPSPGSENDIDRGRLASPGFTMGGFTSTICRARNERLVASIFPFPVSPVRWNCSNAHHCCTDVVRMKPALYDSLNRANAINRISLMPYGPSTNSVMFLRQSGNDCWAVRTTKLSFYRISMNPALRPIFSGTYAGT